MFGLPGHLHAGILSSVAADRLCGSRRASPGFPDRAVHSRVPRVSGAEKEAASSGEGIEETLWERVSAAHLNRNKPIPQDLVTSLIGHSSTSLPSPIRYDVNQEMDIIQSNLAQLRRTAHRSESVWQRFVNQPEIYKPFFIIIMLSVIQQFSGISILR